MNYNNLDENKINDIINEYYLNENILNFKNTELSEYLKTISRINCVLKFYDQFPQMISNILNFPKFNRNLNI